MHIKEYFKGLGKSAPGNDPDPVGNYRQYITTYVGDEDLVKFCFDAMLAEVDFKEGEYTKWNAVAPDYSFVKLKNYKNQEVKASWYLTTNIHW